MSKFIGVFGNTVGYSYKDSDGNSRPLTEDKIKFWLRNGLEKIFPMDIGEDTNDEDVYIVFEQSTDPLNKLVYEYAVKKGLKTVSLYNKDTRNTLQLIYKTDYYRGYNSATKYQTIFDNIDIYLFMGRPRDSFDFCEKYGCERYSLNEEESIK